MATRIEPPEPSAPRAAEAWIDELRRSYAAPGGVHALGQRLAGWRGIADGAVLLYALLRQLEHVTAEVRQLREDLAASRGETTPR